MSMAVAADVRHGFTDPVHEAQAAFRAVLDALARPGTVQCAGRNVEGLRLGAAMAHLLLALTDEDTLVWLQAARPEVAEWLSFHTGAKGTDKPAQAAFAVITDAAHIPRLDTFAAGSLDAPEYSTTLLVEVPALEGGVPLQWHGPGIPGERSVAVGGLPADFWSQWQANHACFPQGVDVIFTCGDRLVGLPRTTRVSRLEGI